MKKRTCVSNLLRALTLLAVAGVAACGQGEQGPQPVQPVSKEDALVRNEAPLVRPISLDRAGEVVNLEFELPPPTENASSTLLVGIRVVAPDAPTGIKRSDEIIRAQLSARVRLLRVEETSITQVALFRNTPDLQNRIVVGDDGLVPGVTSSDVERTQLEGVGLVDASRFYDVLLLAGAEDAKPGHYRLTVELQQDHPQLGSQPAQLLLAYMGKGK